MTVGGEAGGEAKRRRVAGGGGPGPAPTSATVGAAGAGAAEGAGAGGTGEELRAGLEEALGALGAKLEQHRDVWEGARGEEMGGKGGGGGGCWVWVTAWGTPLSPPRASYRETPAGERWARMWLHWAPDRPQRSASVPLLRRRRGISGRPCCTSMQKTFRPRRSGQGLRTAHPTGPGRLGEG